MPVGGDRIEAVSACLSGTEAWFVGGVVRDRLMGRDLADLDLVTAADAEAAARRLADDVGAAVFPLSEEFGGWRVVPREGGWQVDITPLAEGGLEADLARRDLTINAIACPIDRASESGTGQPLPDSSLIDPHGGIHDIEGGVLRAVGDAGFAQDPLRVARLARFACGFGFAIDPRTLGLARDSAAGLKSVAGERVLSELLAILSSEDPAGGIEALKGTGALGAVMPEAAEIEAVEQSVYHHLDVWEHTLETLRIAVELERDPSTLGPAAEAAAGQLAAELGDGASRWTVIRLTLLMHDIAKGRTRTVFDDGRVGFPGHDLLGARMSTGICERLRTSSRVRDRVSAMIAHHLDAGYLSDSMPVTRRDVHAYLVACGAAALDVTVLGIADRLATRGRNSEAAIAKHLELAGILIEAATELELNGAPEPLVRGDRLAEELGIPHGPRLGELLAELAAARYAGEISTESEAIDHARRHLSMLA